MAKAEIGTARQVSCIRLLRLTINGLLMEIENHRLFMFLPFYHLLPLIINFHLASNYFILLPLAIHHLPSIDIKLIFPQINYGLIFTGLSFKWTLNGLDWNTNLRECDRRQVLNGDG